MNAEEFIKDFHDYMAPTMDMYEQAIYLYIIRHSRLVGKKEVVIGFKSERKTFAFGIGKAGTPPSERICYEKVNSLQSKEYIKLLGSERTGTRVRPYLPSEIPGLLENETEGQSLDIEEMDFFEVPENRELILERENYTCFYCRASLNRDNYIMEHVVSRPEGDNSYRNIVASCRTCNNKKGSDEVTVFLRNLYRGNLLNQEEFDEVLLKLEKLKNGELKPIINNS